MQDCRMRRFEGREERNKHVEDKQARPQDNFWAQFKGKILRMWSQCLTQLLCDLLFHHPGHSLEYMRVSVNRCLQACMCVLLQSRVVLLQRLFLCFFIRCIERIRRQAKRKVFGIAENHSCAGSLHIYVLSANVSSCRNASIELLVLCVPT